MDSNNCYCHSHIPVLHDEDIAKISKIFALLSDKTRLKIVLACIEHEKNVSQIVQELNISQSLISHNLRNLKLYRILKSHKSGRNVFYTLNDQHIKHIITNISYHILEKC